MNRYLKDMSIRDKNLKNECASAEKWTKMVFCDKLPNLARYKYIFHVVIDACRLCHNLVCFIAC